MTLNLPGNPKGYPRDTQGIPKGYPRDTQGGNALAIPEQSRSNPQACGLLVARRTPSPPRLLSGANLAVSGQLRDQKSQTFNIADILTLPGHPSILTP